MDQRKPHIAVFSGGECPAERKEYYFRLGYSTGRPLAEAGFTVVTGGGEGLMEQPLRGAAEAGGEPVAVTLEVEGRIQSSHASSVHSHALLAPRQEMLLGLADAFVALPGGVGTLHEIFDVLSLKRVREIAADVPLVLVGEYFRETEALLKNIVEEGFHDASLAARYAIVGTPEEAIALLKDYFA